MYSRDLQVTVAKQSLSSIRRDLKVTATKVTASRSRGLCHPHRSLRRAAVFGVWRVLGGVFCPRAGVHGYTVFAKTYPQLELIGQISMFYIMERGCYYYTTEFYCLSFRIGHELFPNTKIK
jgi:hypothetical protein